MVDRYSSNVEDMSVFMGVYVGVYACTNEGMCTCVDSTCPCLYQ